MTEYYLVLQIMIGVFQIVLVFIHYRLSKMDDGILAMHKECDDNIMKAVKAIKEMQVINQQLIQVNEKNN